MDEDESVRSIEEASESAGYQPATALAPNRLSAMRKRLSILTFQPVPILRNLKQFFVRPPKVNEPVEASLLSVTEASILISRLSEVEDDFFDDDDVPLSEREDMPSLTSDGGSLVSTHRQHAASVMAFEDVEAGITGHQRRKCGPGSRSTFQSFAASDTEAEHNELAGLFETILFIQSAPSLFGFSGTLVQFGPEVVEARTTLWQHAQGDEECSLKWHTDTGAYELILLLRYEMATLNGRSEWAKFATRICVSALIPSTTIRITDPEDNEDLWLSVAEDELSSSASLADTTIRKPVIKVKPPALEHPFSQDLARVLFLHRLCFLVQDQPAHSIRYEVTYVTPHLLEKIASRRASFADAIKLECGIRDNDLKRYERFSFPFSFGSISGTVWCIPLFCALRQLWFCILVKHSQ